LQGPPKVLALEPSEIAGGEQTCRAARTRVPLARLGAAGGGQRAVQVQTSIARGDDRPFDYVLELTHVPGPGVRFEAGGHVGREGLDLPPHAARELSGELLGEQDDVVAALPQRGQG